MVIRDPLAEAARRLHPEPQTSNRADDTMTI
jgi:hypothetical protein